MTFSSVSRCTLSPTDASFHFLLTGSLPIRLRLSHPFLANPLQIPTFDDLAKYGRPADPNQTYFDPDAGRPAPARQSRLGQEREHSHRLPSGFCLTGKRELTCEER